MTVKPEVNVMPEISSATLCTRIDDPKERLPYEFVNDRAPENIFNLPRHRRVTWKNAVLAANAAGI